MKKMMMILLVITALTYSATVNFSSVSAGESVEHVSGEINSVEVFEHVIYIRMKGAGLMANTMASRGVLTSGTQQHGIFAVHKDSKNLLATLLAAHNASKPVALWLTHSSQAESEIGAYNRIMGITF